MADQKPKNEEFKRRLSMSLYSKDAGINTNVSLSATPAQIERKFGVAYIEVEGGAPIQGTFNLQKTAQKKNPMVRIDAFADGSPYKEIVMFKAQSGEGNNFMSGEVTMADGNKHSISGNVMSKNQSSENIIDEWLGAYVHKKDLKLADTAPSAESQADIDSQMSEALDAPAPAADDTEVKVDKPAPAAAP